MLEKNTVIDFKTACWVDNHWEVERPKGIRNVVELQKAINAAQVVFVGDNHSYPGHQQRRIDLGKKITNQNTVVLIEGNALCVAGKVSAYAHLPASQIRSWEPEESLKEGNEHLERLCRQIEVYYPLERFMLWLANDQPGREDNERVGKLGQFLTRVPDNFLGVRISQSAPNSPDYENAFWDLWNRCEEFTQLARNNAPIGIAMIALGQCRGGLDRLLVESDTRIDRWLVRRNENLASTCIGALQEGGITRVFGEMGVGHLRPSDAVSQAACQRLHDRLDEAGISYVALAPKREGRSRQPRASAAPAEYVNGTIYFSDQGTTVRQVLDHFFQTPTQSSHEIVAMAEWLSFYYKQMQVAYMRSAFRAANPDKETPHQ